MPFEAKHRHLLLQATKLTDWTHDVAHVGK